MAMERQDIEQVQQRSNQLNADATVEQVVGETRNAPPASVLITEQEIKFGTASAVGLPRSTAPRWVAAIRTVVVASRWAAVACAPAPNKGYPKLSCSYLRRSLIYRESRRL
jgi:hypothetical protein